MRHVTKARRLLEHTVQMANCQHCQKHRAKQREGSWGSSGSWPRLSSALHRENSPKQGVVEERRQLPSLPQEVED